MNVHIYVDPPYKDSLWCKQTLRGISDEATKKRYNIKMLETDNIYEADLDAFFGEEDRILIVLATSVNQSQKFNDYFNAHGVHLLYVNHQSTNDAFRCSNILVDYQYSMKKITSYLEGCGRKRIALYGINPDSSTDLIKQRYFEERNKQITPYGNGTNIFFRIFDNDQSPTLDCFEQFRMNVEFYDAVICVNDLVAKLLINDLQQIGVRVPEDLYIVSFGDYILAQIGNPTITAVTIDHEHLGRQAVYTYSYLKKISNDVYITAKVAPNLTIGESTNGTEYSKSAHNGTDRDMIECSANFFKHPQIQSIITFENMLTKCDKLDMQILIGIMNRMTYIQLSDSLFVSENVISYRVKRLCKLAELPSKCKLAETANRFLSVGAMEKYIQKKLS